jgi:curli biogenesis system outer membrane secretion channel CsgG
VKYLLTLVCALTMLISSAVAQDVPQGKIRIGIGAVKIVQSLKQQLNQNGQGPAVTRAAETIDAQLMDALQNTRKFEIVARSDLDEMIREQGLPAGVVTDTADTKAAVPAKIKGVEYLVLVTIDDFTDLEQSIYSQEMQMAVSRRTVRMSSVVRIYNTTTGVLLESMSIPSQVESSGTTRVTASDSVKNSKAQDDSAYTELVNQLSQRVAMRVTDIIFPGKVIAVTGGYVTLNRGAGTSINRGELWEVFAAGAELKDPDTGEVLGKEEVKLGEVIISEVLPKFSKAQIYGENRGIAPGMVIRQKLQPQQMPAGQPGQPQPPAEQAR